MHPTAERETKREGGYCSSILLCFLFFCSFPLLKSSLLYSFPLLIYSFLYSFLFSAPLVLKQTSPSVFFSDRENVFWFPLFFFSTFTMFFFCFFFCYVFRSFLSSIPLFHPPTHQLLCFYRIYRGKNRERSLPSLSNHGTGVAGSLAATGKPPQGRSQGLSPLHFCLVAGEGHGFCQGLGK